LKIVSLKNIEAGTSIEADLIIIGGGAAGITIARELRGQNLKIAILESGGLSETPENEQLNAVEITEQPNTPSQVARRKDFHGQLPQLWSHEVQPFGVRCRVLGGSTAAWAGKSAPFDPIDFTKRPWLENSGWMMSREDLDPYIERAAKHLNLGPTANDEAIWNELGVAHDKSLTKMTALRSFFWQFARSRMDAVDIMRFGPEFAQEKAKNIEIYTDATVNELHLDASGTRFSHAEVIATDGSTKVIARANAVVLATGAVENARLLLASKSHFAEGLGNRHDNVGRYLMDHPGARIGSFDKKGTSLVGKTFGYFSLSKAHKTHMYVHGMALTPETQEKDKTLNCAFYLLGEYAVDDPWLSIKRLLRLKSRNPFADLFSVLKSPGMLITGIGRKFLQARAVPPFLKKMIVDTIILFNPNFAVGEFQSRGLPHKLASMHIEVITEQAPERENRVTLSKTLDRLGRPLPQIAWKVGSKSEQTIVHMARVIQSEFARVGLKPPTLADWVEKEAFDQGGIVDMAHTAGTTRMSLDPTTGVVDENCMVYGIEGLYIAGGSVFPTSGHANSTLMIVSLAVRLSDYLRVKLR
jgi:choline dehydrogenase-like flavoprotein